MGYPDLNLCLCAYLGPYTPNPKPAFSSSKIWVPHQAPQRRSTAARSLASDLVIHSSLLQPYTIVDDTIVLKVEYSISDSILLYSIVSGPQKVVSERRRRSHQAWATC